MLRGTRNNDEGVSVSQTIFSPEVVKHMEQVVADYTSLLKEGAGIDKTLRAFARELLKQLYPLLTEQGVAPARRT